MALQSKLFRGDAKLESAAVSDPAHIVPGATGPHVGKIQRALIELDDADLIADSVYGPKTAAAVLAYKRKRNIVNRAYQAQADNIVGKMTIAALDREMLAHETVVPSGPIRIKALHPAAGVASAADIPRFVPQLPQLLAAVGGEPIAAGSLRPAGLLLGFKIDVDVPLDPSGSFFKIRLDSRSTGILEIVNGTPSGNVRCTNVTPLGDGQEKTCWIYDPGGPSDVPQIRLNPDPSGPEKILGEKNGGIINPVRSDPLLVKVDAFRPGDAHIVATTATSSSTVIVEVRARRLGPVSDQPPPTKIDPRSNGLVSADNDPSYKPRPGGENSGGRPVNPIGTGRMVNLGGEAETGGFEDYSVNLPFSGHNRSNTRWTFRPWTEDPDPAVGVGSGTASDICSRGTPVHDDTIAAIRRIAAHPCRLTYSGDKKGIARLKSEFTGKILAEVPSPNDAIVILLP